MRFLRAYATLSHAIIAAFSSARIQALLLVCLLIASCQALVFRVVEGWRLLDGFYFSVVSMATVGYGDLAPATPLGKLLTMLFLMIGVGIFVLTVSSIAQAILQEMTKSEGDSAPSEKTGSE
jgi:voltage-gated potassium channel